MWLWYPARSSYCLKETYHRKSFNHVILFFPCQNIHGLIFHVTSFTQKSRILFTLIPHLSTFTVIPGTACRGSSRQNLDQSWPLYYCLFLTYIAYYLSINVKYKGWSTQNNCLRAQIRMVCPLWYGCNYSVSQKPLPEF